ncbi:MAG: hypothetical protein V2I79_12060 [Xanthomonadales bacterium]|jgi:hypothetical protein|nr:hypothetical protein [Xanthomonadales bacterium]
MNMQQNPQLRKKNIRTAVILGVIAVVVMLLSVPFWINLFKLAIDLPG